MSWMARTQTNSRTIANDLVVEWEKDALTDLDGDGILDNDWSTSNETLATLVTLVWEDLVKRFFW